MSLRESLRVKPVQRVCKIGNLLGTESPLDVEDKQALQNALFPPNTSTPAPGRGLISEALRNEGYQVSPSLVRDHRAGLCACRNSKDVSDVTI